MPTNQPIGTPYPIILASSSRYRAALLARLQLDFLQHSPDVDETPLAGESPARLAERLARDKARAVAAMHPGCLVIGSDQVASLDSEFLAKPGSAERAYRQLARCSGKTVQFHTGLCLAGPEDAVTSLVDTFTVVFRKLTDAQIKRYIEREQPLDCAGSFKAEGLGISLFEKFSGKDPNTLIGLPLMDLVTLLNQRGIAIP